jgi:hypothetical protein
MIAVDAAAVAAVVRVVAAILVWRVLIFTNPNESVKRFSKCRSHGVIDREIDGSIEDLKTVLKVSIYEQVKSLE